MADYNSNSFKTFDLALAAALVTAGYSIEEIEKKPYGKASFVFVRSDKLDAVVNHYWADKLQLNPKAYFDVLKHLKTRIYSEA